MKEICKWRKFRSYLGSTGKPLSVNIADHFEKYLPYAIAFGVEDTYIREGIKAGVPMPMPSWIHFPDAGNTNTTARLADNQLIFRNILRLLKQAGSAKSNRSSGFGGGGGGGG